MAASPQARGLRALSVLLGVFFLFQGISKIGWLMDPSPLTAQLTGYLENANAWNRPYLERVCIPFAPVFARLVLFGELATGVSLITGVWTRYAAAVCLLMVMNIHFSSGLLFQYASSPMATAFRSSAGCWRWPSAPSGCRCSLKEVSSDVNTRRTGRERFTELLFYAVVILVAYLAMLVVWPFLGPLAWAAILAVTLRPGLHAVLHPPAQQQCRAGHHAARRGGHHRAGRVPGRGRRAAGAAGARLREQPLGDHAPSKSCGCGRRCARGCRFHCRPIR